MTEVEKVLEQLERFQINIDAYKRLGENPDFKVFMADIDIRRDFLREALEAKEDAEIRGMLKNIRGIKELFHATVGREKEVTKKIKELKDAKSGKKAV